MFIYKYMTLRLYYRLAALEVTDTDNTTNNSTRDRNNHQSAHAISVQLQIVNACISSYIYLLPTCCLRSIVFYPIINRESSHIVVHCVHFKVEYSHQDTPGNHLDTSHAKFPFQIYHLISILGTDEVYICMNYSELHSLAVNYH